MPDFIQPWDKEYWSKGARRKLFKEYSAGQVEEQRQIAEAREKAALERQLKVEERANEYGTRRDEAGRTFASTESGLGRAHDERRDELSNQRRLAAAKDEQTHELSLADLNDRRQRALLQEEANIAGQTRAAKRTEDEAPIRESLHSQYMQAIRADSPNVDEEQAQIEAATFANQGIQRLTDMKVQGELAKGQALIENPALGFPGVYQAQAKTAQEFAEQMDAYNRRKAYLKNDPELVGPPPTPPGRATGLGRMSEPMGGGRLGDGDGREGRRIQLGPPKKRVTELRERYKLGQ